MASTTRPTIFNRLKANRVFKYLASVRFAIPVMVAWALAMTWGTIAESLYGTQYAKIQVYHSTWFYLIQAAIALSLLLAMIVRIPLKMRLAGFYIVHISLLMVMAGAVVTRYRGIDGVIQLSPGRSTSSVLLEEDRVYISLADNEISFELPSATGAVDLAEQGNLADGSRVTFLKYLPFAKQEKAWVKDEGAWHSQWRLKSARAEQMIELSNRPNGEIGDRAEAGALALELMDAKSLEPLVQAFQNGQGEYALMNLATGAVAPIGSLAKPVTLTLSGEKVSLKAVENPKMKLIAYVLETQTETHRFFPKFSSAPISKHMEADLSAAYRLVSLAPYRETNTVLIARQGSGEVLVAFGKGKDWKTAVGQRSVALPWMGFELELVSERAGEVSVPVYVEGVPNKKQEENVKALLVRLEKNGQSEEAWLTDRAMSGFRLAAVTGRIGKQTVGLPFKMTLDRFKMDMVPRTNEPASYESFVKIDGATEPVHIFMNNPYKAAGYTFYQSSYYQGEDGQYNSVLSVNKDPGRWLKYLGSALLVFGLVLHFLTIYGKGPRATLAAGGAT